jgi:hypothetical protein
MMIANKKKMFTHPFIWIRRRDSSVSIARSYGLDVWVWIPRRGKIIQFHIVQTGSIAQLYSYLRGTEGFIHRRKALVPEANHSHPSSVEIKNLGDIIPPPTTCLHGILFYSLSTGSFIFLPCIFEFTTEPTTSLTTRNITSHYKAMLHEPFGGLPHNNPVQTITAQHRYLNYILLLEDSTNTKLIAAVSSFLVRAIATYDSSLIKAKFFALFPHLFLLSHIYIFYTLPKIDNTCRERVSFPVSRSQYRRHLVVSTSICNV